MPRKKPAPNDLTGLAEPLKKDRTPITTIDQVLDRKNSPIEQKRIAMELMSLMGGERGLAKRLMEEYKATTPGSLARARFFGVLLKLVAMATPKEIQGDLDYITEEDIGRILREHVADQGVKADGYPTHVCI